MAIVDSEVLTLQDMALWSQKMPSIRFLVVEADIAHLHIHASRTISQDRRR